jgi:hypothetical protein
MKLIKKILGLFVKDDFEIVVWHKGNVPDIDAKLFRTTLKIGKIEIPENWVTLR